MNIENPNESERIQDIDKAEAMALFENEYRKENISRLQKALELPWSETIKDGYREQIKLWEDKSNQLAELEGAKYEARRDSDGMTREEISFKADELNEALKLARDKMYELRQKAIDESTRENIEAKNLAEKEERELSLKAFAWGLVLKERK